MKIRKLIYCLVLIYVLIVLFNYKANASVSSCTASVTPNTAIRNTTNDFTFSLSNTGTVTYNWIKIRRPSESVLWTINTAGATGWSASVNENDVTFTSGSLGSEGSLTITINATAADTSDSSPLNWVFEVSDDGGSDKFACSGNFQAVIIEPPADELPTMSNITISDITSSSINMSWTTNEVTTYNIEYGATEDYGLTKSSSALTTSHNVTFDSLSANTLYHFNITSTDSAGGSVQYGDATFTTAKAGLTSEAITITKIVTPTPTPTPVPDTTRPTVIVSTDFSKPFEAAPEIFAKATDNKGVSKAEYSIDNGKNWLPVSLSSSGRATYSFSFVPDVQDDGNYELVVRATDSSGNTGSSKKYTMIIDRLVPQISGVLFSLGPQILTPQKDGNILIIQGERFKITLSDVGGATSIDVFANPLDNLSHTSSGSGSKKFRFIKNPDSGLWSANLNLGKEGEYQLRISAVDGAGNKTETDLNKVVVVESGRISSVNGNVSNAKITVYYQEPRSKAWQIWDGGAYSQTNPQKTDKNGNYSLFLPAGKYYLQVESYGFQSQTSEFFTVDSAESINADFTLKPLKLIFSLGFIKLYWPDFSTLTASFKNNLPQVSSNKNQLIGKQMPFFSLIDGFKSDSLFGKPSILTFLNTWSPASSEQVSILNSFSKNNNFNSATIIEGEKSSKVFVFKKRGSYNLPMYTDPDATLVTTYNLNVLPTSYFIDRKGVIKDIVIGVLSQEEIEEKLLNIVQ